MDALLTRIQEWYKRPFDPNGNAFNWALFLAFALTIAFAWTRILKHITE